jgi:type IV pilus assembly protein PilO
MGLFLALSGLLFCFYMTVYKPLQQDVFQKKAQLKIERQLVSIQHNEAHTEDGTERKSAKELQKVIPSEPLIEQFILDIEKAEVKSNSLVQQMTFGESGTAAEDTSTSLDEYNDMDKNYDSSDEKEKAEEAERESKNVVMPEGLQKETIHLSVESPTYFDLEMFLATLQAGKRYVEVENLTFTGSAEKVLLDEEKTDKLTYELDVSVYYHTGLGDLKKDLPALDTPPPGNKQQPFTNG